jgi:RNA polymerase sigma-70 factor (ECF subfamily)
VTVFDASSDDLDRVFREEHGQVVATLVRQFGDIDLAEDAAQEACVAALQRWPTSGVPPNPGGWLTTTARNRAIDRLRHESTREARHAHAALLSDINDNSPVSSVVDDRLRLMFTCCHPALATSAQVALTLRLLGRLTMAEIAHAFLVDQAAMAKRLTRAKQKIKAARIPYRVPADHELPGRLRGVLATLYLIFNEGYLASAGDAAIRTDLCAEAIRLARVLVGLMPDELEVRGLLALMVLTDARRPARVADGALVTLPEQDRRRWDRRLIAEGHDLVRSCLRHGRPGRFQLLAAINAVHTDAPTAQDTDWQQIVALYDQLHAIEPTPVVALNRAVAVAEVDGPDAGLALLDALDLAQYHPFHSSRADLLRRAGRRSEARAAYQRAIELTTNPAELTFLRARLDSVRGDSNRHDRGSG